jgi:hypothetical protein
METVTSCKQKKSDRPLNVATFSQGKANMHVLKRPQTAGTWRLQASYQLTW